MNCPKCGIDLAPGSRECPVCGIVLAKYRGPAKPSGPGPVGPGPVGPGPVGPGPVLTTEEGSLPLNRPAREEPLPLDWSAPGALGGPGQSRAPGASPGRSIRGGSRRWLGATVIGLAGAAGLAWLLWPVSFPRVSLTAAASNSQASDPCEDRRRCVVVFVAPWCNACKMALPIIKKMSQRWASASGIGIKPVVGLAPEDQCERMAEALGAPAFLDPAGKLMKALGEKSVPHWFVVDAAGKIKKRLSGVVLDVKMQIDRLGLAEQDLAQQASP
jgi:thiol-disulfide isomerase/thioredoxin